MDGLASKQIAEKLFLSIQTINAHRKNMLRKTNCTNFTEIAKKLILKAENYHILVSDANLAAFISRMKELGYLIGES